MEIPELHALRKKAHDEGIRLHTQHLRIFEALALRKRRNLVGPIEYEVLALAADSKSSDPSRLLAARIPLLRRALEHFSLDVTNYRNKGYELCEVF